jgi:hypothetical protein
MDYALTIDDTDKSKLLAHKADCPMARKLAAAGEPVMTLFQCEAPLPADIKRHTCLDDKS